jgi:hypothetical protein
MTVLHSAVALCLGASAKQLVERPAILNQFVGHSDSELEQQLSVPTRT